MSEYVQPEAKVLFMNAYILADRLFLQLVFVRL